MATCQFTPCLAISSRLRHTLVAGIGKDIVSSPCSKPLACVTSLTLAAVPTTVCTSPESASTPMCAFMPKCHWLPFLVWCISGSRSPLLFLVELGRGNQGGVHHRAALEQQALVRRAWR